MTDQLARARVILAEPWQHPVLRDVMEKLVHELASYRAWVADLQSGMYVNCVYCGHRYGPGETTPVSMADALKAHIAQCPEHPMSGLLKACTAASSALKSYACGNASTELARDAGAAQANAPDRPPSTAELHGRVIGKLDGPLRKLFEPVIDVYPATLSVDEWANRSGYAPGTGTFNKYRSSLRALELVDYPSAGQVQAKAWLFP